MKHIEQILWLLSWPVLIYVSYRLVLFALRTYEKKFQATSADKQEIKET